MWGLCIRRCKPGSSEQRKKRTGPSSFGVDKECGLDSKHGTVRERTRFSFVVVFVGAEARVPAPPEALFELGETVEKLLMFDGARRERGLQVIHYF